MSRRIYTGYLYPFTCRLFRVRLRGKEVTSDQSDGKTTHGSGISSTHGYVERPGLLQIHARKRHPRRHVVRARSAFLFRYFPFHFFIINFIFVFIVLSFSLSFLFYPFVTLNNCFFSFASVRGRLIPTQHEPTLSEADEEEPQATAMGAAEAEMPPMVERYVQADGSTYAPPPTSEMRHQGVPMPLEEMVGHNRGERNEKYPSDAAEAMNHR